MRYALFKESNMEYADAGVLRQVIRKLIELNGEIGQKSLTSYDPNKRLTLVYAVNDTLPLNHAVSIELYTEFGYHDLPDPPRGVWAVVCHDVNGRIIDFEHPFTFRNIEDLNMLVYAMEYSDLIVDWIRLENQEDSMYEEFFERIEAEKIRAVLRLSGYEELKY